MRNNIIGLIAGFVLAAFVVGGNGCMSEEQARGIRDTVAIGVDTGDALVASLAEEREAALQRAEAAEEALDTARAEAERLAAEKLKNAIDEVDEYLTPAKENLAAWDKALANWDDASAGAGLIGEIGSTVLPFLPPGSQVPAVMALGVGGALWRAFNRANGLKSLAQSTVTLAEKNPDAREAIAAGAALLSKIQNPAAKKAIDAAQGKKSSLPL